MIRERLPQPDSFDWLLIMGRPMSVNDETVYTWLREEKQLICQAMAGNKTLLRICFGGQLIASALGAEVYRNNVAEIGWFPVIRIDTDLKWLPESVRLLSWHGECFSVVAGAIPFATSTATSCQGFSLGQKIWALPFHLEAQPGIVDAFLANENTAVPEGGDVQSETQLRNDDFLPQSQIIIHRLLDSLL